MDWNIFQDIVIPFVFECIGCGFGCHKHNLGIILSNQTTTFVILVICLMRIPSTSLTLLFRNIEVKESASANETMDLVLKWREHYLLVCEFVESLNDFIGAPFFIFITYAFHYFLFLLRFTNIFPRTSNNQLDEFSLQSTIYSHIG